MARAKSKKATSVIKGADLLLNPRSLPDGRIYVIFGDDPFLQQEVWSLIRMRATKGQDEGLSVSRFDGTSAELRDVLDELCTPSFFGGGRVVFVDEADKFISNYQDRLAEALARRPIRGTLVFRCKSWKGEEKLTSLVNSVGCMIDCSPPSRREVTSWLPKWAQKQFGKVLSSDACGLLLEYVGPDLGRLHQELEKLSLYVGERTTIEPEDVDRIVTHGRARTAWELADAVANGNVTQALEILDRLLTAGEDPLSILYALGFHFRRLAKAARLILAGTNTSQALKSVGVQPFVIDSSVVQLRRLGRVRLLRLFDLLLETDLALKSTDIDPRLALEQLIVALAAPQDAFPSGRFLRSIT